MKQVLPNLTGEQARVAMQLIEVVVDTLIELHTRMELEYEPWGEELHRDQPSFGSLEDFLGLITRPVHERAESDDR